jgi:hypothetical protein
MDQSAIDMVAMLTRKLEEQEARHQKEIELLTQRLEQLSTPAGTTSPPSPPLATDPRSSSPTNKASLSERLPDPPAFTGKSKDLRSFLVKLRAKLEINQDRFPTPRSQFLYACSLLGGDAARIAEPLFDKDICSLEQLVAFLEASYGDPNRRAAAQAKLTKFKQKGSFYAHFSEFRRLSADAGFNESALVTQLKNSLSEPLQRAMVGQVIPDSLNEYANLIARFDNDLRYLPKHKSYATPTPRPSQSYPDPDAMEIDSATSSYAPKGSAERQRRIREGRCFKCGSKNHISPDCKAPIPRSIRAGSPTSSGASHRGRSPRATTPPEPAYQARTSKGSYNNSRGHRSSLSSSSSSSSRHSSSRSSRHAASKKGKGPSRA